MSVKSPKLFLLSACIGLGFAVPSQATDPADCKNVRFSDVGWTDITSTTAVSSLVLEGLGYEPKVHVLSVPHLHDVNDEFIILHGIDNSVDALSDSVPFLARELLASARTGIVRKPLYSVDHSTSIASVCNLLNLFGGRRLDQNSISCHDALDP